MNRPTITTEMVAAVASEIANEIGIEAETIAKAYSRYFDGYQLARELERCHYVDDLCIDDVNRLDEISGLVDEALRKAEKAWAEENNIQPKLSVGAVIGSGVIAGVCQHSPARYLVKEHGCTQDGRFLLVRFEDAEKQPSEAGDCK